MTVITDRSLGRVRLSVTSPDGRRVDHGRVNVTISAGRVVALRRQVEVAAGTVVDVDSPARKITVLTIDSGEVWRTQGCGCGGG